MRDLVERRYEFCREKSEVRGGEEGGEK